jgi:plastocyanin
MRPLVRAGVGLAIVLVVGACTSGATSPPATTAPTTAPPPPAATDGGTPAGACSDVTEGGEATTVAVSVEGFQFVPSTIQAKVGDVVTFTNGDSAPHGVALDDGGCRTASNMGRGDSRSLQFSEAGEFAFHCTVHADMTGRLVISE